MREELEGEHPREPHGGCPAAACAVAAFRLIEPPHPRALARPAAVASSGGARDGFRKEPDWDLQVNISPKKS